jgi:aminoglycoside phosphotransferase (APT) family kinase protein
VVRVVSSGWDSLVLILPGRWVLRIARNDWAANGYAVEKAVLSRLAPTLPARVPVPVRSGRRWTLTRLIDGRPAGAESSASVGEQLGSFLRALHAFPVAKARALRVPDERRTVNLERFRNLVLPLLDEAERPPGERLLEEHERATFEPALTHADLGPEHIVVQDDQLSGVIDWTDMCIGDPAIDLAWPLYGAPREFAAAVRERYGVSDELARRALVFHALGPWHEVVYGLRTDRRWIESGLAGVRARLPKATGDAATMDR